MSEKAYTNIAASTSHAQEREIQIALGGSAGLQKQLDEANAKLAQLGDAQALQDALTREQKLRGTAENDLNAAHGEIEALTGQLAAEKEAHAATQAALDAATKTAE